MTEPDLLLLWAKTCRDQNKPESDWLYHPLLFHLLDVGHCVLGLWDTYLSDNWKKRIAVTLNCDEASARRVVAFLAGTHDIGKVSPGFQFQIEKTALSWLCERLRKTDLVVPTYAENKPHNFISSKKLHFFWTQSLWHWQAEKRRLCL
jgi:CRISPR-associated endonuclease/helicase Cas3